MRECLFAERKFNMVNLKSLISEIASEQNIKPIEKKKLTPEELFDAEMELTIRLCEMGRSELYNELISNLHLDPEQVDRPLIILCLKEILQEIKGLDLIDKDTVASELCKKLGSQYSHSDAYIASRLIEKNLAKAFIYSDTEGIR